MPLLKSKIKSVVDFGMSVILDIIVPIISSVQNLSQKSCSCYIWFQRKKVPAENLQSMSLYTHRVCVLINIDLIPWQIVYSLFLETIRFSYTQKDWWYLTRRQILFILMKCLPHRNFRIWDSHLLYSISSDYMMLSFIFSFSNLVWMNVLIVKF